ncbi:MAG: alpha/beta hydrolase [Proteobacteria bacterium]|nr:alpha/beta hydrolase [Pseudomonadota bacterium]
MKNGFRLQVQGRAIGYETGPRGIEPGRPTVVLLPGAGGSTLAWRVQLRLLDHRVNALAVDPPGRGWTPGPPLTRIRDWADWTAALIAALPLTNTPVLAGLSLGGAAAIETALVHPDRISGLVLVSTGARLAGNPVLADRTDAPPITAERLAEWFFGPNASPALARQSAAILAGVPPEAMRADLAAGRSFDRRADLARIRVPALVLCGDRDRITPPEMSRALADGLPRARLVLLPGAGHMAVIERARDIGRLILDFVDPPTRQIIS